MKENEIYFDSLAGAVDGIIAAAENAKFTIKEHSTFNGLPQTKILRAKVWNDRLVCS